MAAVSGIPDFNKTDADAAVAWAAARIRLGKYTPVTAKVLMQYVDETIRDDVARRLAARTGA